MIRQPRAFWVTGPGTGEIRSEPAREPRPGEVRVRALWSGVSRGTEQLVFRGQVPASEHLRMRCPFQAGDFPAPVKYGYLSVGTVDAGPAELQGRTVFCLHPHQTSYVVPASSVVSVPADVPPRRAVLTGAVETAVNALWDAPPQVGDRVTVVGAGMIGCCVARLAARVPGVTVTLVDVDPARACVAGALGAGFALPGEAGGEQDLVFHASATASGLRTALDLLGDDGTVIELSWYGDRDVALSLGGSFHARRSTIRASQVGTLAPGARGRWTHRGRLALALGLLRDHALDLLLTDGSAFDELPALMTAIASGAAPGLCHTIAYPREDDRCST